jgi:hypothetical protein
VFFIQNLFPVSSVLLCFSTFFWSLRQRTLKRFFINRHTG